MPARKAKKRGTKKAGTKKATKTNLEAKIAKLQAKLNTLSAQAAKSAKARALPPKIYTGENYYRTRQRLAYHPPDKQFMRRKTIKFKKFPTVAQVEAATRSQTAKKTAKEKKSKTEELAEYEKKYLKRWQQQKFEVAKPTPAAKPAPAPKPEPQPEPKKEKPKRTEVPAPKVNYYTGENYYRTRQRLAYHPSDKQFREGQVARTVQVSSPPKPAPEHVPEPQQEPKKEKPKRTEEVPAPKVKYTGENYYRTRQRLAYHPSDKQFTGG